MKLKWLLRSLVITTVFIFIIGTNVSFALAEIVEFELEIELKNGEEYEVEYELKGTQYEASYQEPGSPTLYAEDAKAMIEPFLTRLEITEDKNMQELQKGMYDIFKVDANDVAEFECKVIFKSGKKIKKKE